MKKLLFVVHDHHGMGFAHGPRDEYRCLAVSAGVFLEYMENVWNLSSEDLFRTTCECCGPNFGIYVSDPDNEDSLEFAYTSKDLYIAAAKVAASLED
jgi:hypothetical protein